MADFTKYIFNGNEYAKRRLVLAVIKKYMQDKRPDLSSLLEAFPPELQGNYGVVIPEYDFNEKHKNNDDPVDRYFFKPDEALTTSDGIKVFVSSQWGTKDDGAGNFDRFCEKAIDLGYEIKMKDGVGKSIKELFEEYKNNPRLKWMASFKESSDTLLTYKDKTPDDYDLELIDEVWKSSHNGVASVKPGFISNREYDALIADLPEITSKIVRDPSSATYDEVVDWAMDAKNKGVFTSIKWGVIHRVFATANPENCSTLLENKKVVNLINKLNELYDLGISKNGNWVVLNISLLNALRSQGLENEDVFMVNTFVWRLYVSLVKDVSKTKDLIDEELLSFDKERSCVNIIYYGPPGTGKTYQLQELLKHNYTDKNDLPDKNIWLNEQLEELRWYEIIILVLMDLEGYKKVTDIISHEYYQAKAKLNERGTNLRATAWSALQSHTVHGSATVNIKNRIDPLVFNKTENSVWYIEESQIDQLEEYKDLLEKLKSGPEKVEFIKRYAFVTFHQSYGYEEFIEGLRPVTDTEGNITYEVKPGVFKRICKQAEQDSDNQYAIVIDEINRGNISKIFGELITLVETDKRAGAENALTLTLPYSGLPFSVPSNLDIIGTMNTADRSLTHIDVALRRRFEFIELRTDYSLVPDDMDGINLRWMLYAINQRIELLLDREHILGHALLMSVSSIEELAHTFATNIMPLLEEYFFENWDKINSVLNDNGFIEEQEGAFATWLGDGGDYVAKSYRINLEKLADPEAYKVIYSDVPDNAFAECSTDTE